jgi:hypothetical protein
LVTNKPETLAQWSEGLIPETLRQSLVELKPETLEQALVSNKLETLREDEASSKTEKHPVASALESSGSESSFRLVSMLYNFCFAVAK